MAAVQVLIGTTQGTITALPSAPKAPIIPQYNEKIKTSSTLHGYTTYSIVGQRKRVYELNYDFLTQAQYATFASYALSSRKWWVRITGFSTTYIFNGFAFVQFGEISIPEVRDDAIVYKIKLLVFEL